MTMTELLTLVKMDLGITGIYLPFEDPEKELSTVIKMKTLPIFSIYSPQIVKVHLSLDQLTCLKQTYQESIYEIPDIFGDRKLFSIRRVDPKTSLMNTVYYEGLYDFQNIAMGQANANLISSSLPAYTFKFTAPNLLHLFNMSSLYGEVDVEFNIEHAANLSTIKPTTWDSFYELAKLDIKIFLYGVLRMYNQIQTAYGTIDLKIDDWSSASGDRDTLISNWKNSYHMDAVQYNII